MLNKVNKEEVIVEVSLIAIKDFYDKSDKVSNERIINVSAVTTT